MSHSETHTVPLIALNDATVGVWARQERSLLLDVPLVPV